MNDNGTTVVKQTNNSNAVLIDTRDKARMDYYRLQQKGSNIPSTSQKKILLDKAEMVLKQLESTDSINKMNMLRKHLARIDKALSSSA